MVMDYISRAIFGFLIKHRVISIGTKYYPTNDMERDYVDMINYTRTMLLEIEPAHITTQNIFHNLVNEVGNGNIPQNRKFIEIKPAENEINEYALLSNIIMGSDRFLYVEVFRSDRTLINEFVDIIKKGKGQIIEQSNSEIVSRLLSKNDAIRIAVKLISLGMEKGTDVRAAVGMTGAASIERSINLNKQIGETSGVGFTKLGGEFAVVFSSAFGSLEGNPTSYDNYLFIDAVDSTQFIAENGRDKLVEIMNDVTNFIENDCEGKIEGYREGGDDLIATMPTKDAALRAGIDSSWHSLNNGLRLRAGIGKSRREAGERAQMADNIKIWKNSPVVVFDLADGIYSYYIPSEFTRSILDFLMDKKSRIAVIFIFVFFATLIGWNVGHPEFGLVAIVLAVIYALTN
ncbi:hypothetical protein [Methanobacterium paludis]|uniref:Uncharacterized protein n=1 Tax=Methanobacterium paludis (strain DSM 25820 / JCM 18151 / SWAN1) TaxID=868131 RepID=F6D692_METPW|nr:hypothetical protein [Methanobacterium paludis]AEG18305.1 hypothetical protein MSWAN_1288 [Methanobacterium paludis]